jgi:hypothetical protein
LHNGDSHDDGHESSAQRVQLDHCTDGFSGLLLGEDFMSRIPSQDDDQGDSRTGDLNIDFDGEYI